MKNIVKYRKQTLFIIDLLVIILVYVILFLLTPLDNGINSNRSIHLLYHILILVISISACQIILKTYDTIWRYAMCNEYLTLMAGVISGYFILFIFTYNHQFSISSYVAGCSITNLILLITRLLYKKYSTTNKYEQMFKYVAIIGAGSLGVGLMEEFKYHPNNKYKVYCFIDDDTQKIGKKIQGIKVVGPIENITSLIKKSPISEVILAIPSLSKETCEYIIEKVERNNIPVKIMPDIISLLDNGEPNVLGYHKLNMDVLLGRECVTFDRTEIEPYVEGKVIMVTGGGGSIGSELCRQIAKSKPSLIIIVDYYENNAYDVQQELNGKYKDTLNLVVEIANLQDKVKLDVIFNRYRPQIVFHAAAHKHVPFMENCPDEAIKNNVFATYNVVLLSDKYETEKFVLISTDKAVNPSSIMGATKRLCEMMILSMKNISKTKYVAVRFGNVLGSNGSIIPLFKKQIEQGGPVTITDKRAYRYFMTIPEAAELVLRAASMSTDSEIYVLDMGKPMNILTLAENLIRLMGYIPYVEIPIKEIGIRPGEKLHEELLMQEEELVKTNNHKIFIERQKNDITSDEILQKLELLENALETNKLEVIRQTIIDVVPTFKKIET